jgi:HEPN domain-containing protein
MADRSGDWLHQAERDLEQAEDSRRLDNFYIPTRYANSHPTGAPFEHYGPLQSQQAIDYVSEILEFARSQVA